MEHLAPLEYTVEVYLFRTKAKGVQNFKNSVIPPNIKKKEKKKKKPNLQKVKQSWLFLSQNPKVHLVSNLIPC